MKGRSYANVFVHFIPENHDQRNEQEQHEIAAHGASGGHEAFNHDEMSLEKHLKLHDLDNRKKLRGSGDENAEEKLSLSQLTDRLHCILQPPKETCSNWSCLLRDYVPGKEDIVNAKDANGWMPIHEASRRGNLDVIKYLNANGADLNAECNSGTALDIAREAKADKIVAYLESMGAKDTSIPQEEET